MNLDVSVFQKHPKEILDHSCENGTEFKADNLTFSDSYEAVVHIIQQQPHVILLCSWANN
jgi:hypothetical protein